MGLLLAITFFLVLTIFCAPVFSGSNGLEQSDRLFNRLAKGSSYFIPALSSKVREFDKQVVAVSIPMESAELAGQAVSILSKAAPDTTAEGAVVNVRGSLGEILGAALRDCDSMYSNHADDLKARYGIEGKQTMVVWFTTLTAIAKQLQKGSIADIARSKMILTVISKGIEPAYNFYGILPERVSQKAGLTSFLLVFYLVYTVWWGFAIYFLCEGFGLAMTKARVKREV